MIDDIVLIFAYHYRPGSAIGAERPFRFAKYLRRLGYRVHIISATDPANRPEPDTEYIPDPFPKGQGGPRWHLERAVRALAMPGSEGIGWAWNAAYAARKFLAANRGHRVTLFSTFPPIGTHLAGLLLSASERLPWIADYRDPLPGIFMNLPDADAKPLRGHRYYRAIQHALERFLVPRADVCIANTELARGRLVKLFPGRAQHIHLIWNGFDPEEREPFAEPPPGILTVAHVGSLYFGRTAAPLLHSAGRLIEASRLDPGALRIRLLGPAHADCLPDAGFIARASAAGWLEVHPNQIPKDEARQADREAHGYLVIQPQSRVQVPGKLFPFILSGRPVLAHVPRGSSVEEILRLGGAPHTCLYTDMTEDEMDAAVLSFFRGSFRPVPPNPRFEAEFSAEAQTRSLHEMIQSLGPRNA